MDARWNDDGKGILRLRSRSHFRLQLLRILEEPMAHTGVMKKALQIEAASEQARSASVVVDAMADEGLDGVVLSFPEGTKGGVCPPLRARCVALGRRGR